jgi:hypothetical protein
MPLLLGGQNKDGVMQRCEKMGGKSVSPLVVVEVPFV